MAICSTLAVAEKIRFHLYTVNKILLPSITSKFVEIRRVFTYIAMHVQLPSFLRLSLTGKRIKFVIFSRNILGYIIRCLG